MLVNILSSYKMFKLMQSAANNESSKQLLLEPLCCILRLVILSYKPEGTKISIIDNSISFQDYSYYQGFIRSFQGDNREDLHILYHPIIKSLEWYTHDSDIFAHIYKRSIQGLESLIKTYEHKTTIIYTLSHYIEILKGNHKDKINQETISPLIDGFKDFWTQEEIDMIYQLCLLIETNTNKDIYLTSLEDIIRQKEHKVHEYIITSSTTYSK